MERWARRSWSDLLDAFGERLAGTDDVRCPYAQSSLHGLEVWNGSVYCRRCAIQGDIVDYVRWVLCPEMDATTGRRAALFELTPRANEGVSADRPGPFAGRIGGQRVFVDWDGESWTLERAEGGVRFSRAGESLSTQVPARDVRRIGPIRLQLLLEQARQESDDERRRQLRRDQRSSYMRHLSTLSNDDLLAERARARHRDLVRAEIRRRCQARSLGDPCPGCADHLVPGAVRCERCGWQYAVAAMERDSNPYDYELADT